MTEESMNQENEIAIEIEELEAKVAPSGETVMPLIGHGK